MSNKKKDATKNLLNLMKDMPLLRTPDNSVFITIERNGRKENINLGSHVFRDYIKSEYYTCFDGFPSDYAINNAIAYIRNKAMSDEITETKYRVLLKNGAIYYDLSDQDGQYVKITRKGWTIESNWVDNFVKGPGQLYQTCPSKYRGNMPRLKEFVNLTDEDWIFFAAYLISCFLPDIQHPIINIKGSNGSGKSTLARIIKKLVDPSVNELENFQIGSQDNLVARIISTYYVAFDNLSNITKSQSDFLCMLVTSAAFSKRKMYTDVDLSSVKLEGPISLNGIVDIIRTPDLAQRCLFFETRVIDGRKRRTEREFWKAFEDSKPEILAGIFDVLCNAMAIKDEIHLAEHQRLADFHEWGYAIAEAMGGYGQQFLDAMKRNEIRQAQVSRDNNVLVQLMVDFLEDVDHWSGSLTLLYKCLKITIEGDITHQYDNYAQFPKDVSRMSKKLRELQSVLLTYGVSITFFRDSGNFSCIEISSIFPKRVPIRSIRKPITEIKHL